MGSNSFGNLFKVMTWGESHGKAIGVVIDGCPANLPLTEDDIEKELFYRRPGRSSFTSPRDEKDHPQILSGVFDGKTTGAPISIMIENKDADSSKYEEMKDLLRPGHANYTYLEKYGVFDYRGGGRSSGRETACRVAAGAVAKKLLTHFGIELIAYIRAIGGVEGRSYETDDKVELRKKVYESPIFCPDEEASSLMMKEIEKVKKEGDSLGGIVELIGFSLPVGLGDPVYEKLSANLAKAMVSIPAVKGFEIGSGFNAAGMRGSSHNDLFIKDGKGIQTKTNNAGGVLGGISNGSRLVVRVAFKPTSSIQKQQETLDTSGEKKTLSLPAGSKHDPCIAIRAVSVVEAMGALVIADAILTQVVS